MEKNIENGNTTLKLLLIIFIIISLVLGGFTIYDKVLKKNDKCVKQESSCDYSKCEKESLIGENNNELSIKENLNKLLKRIYSGKIYYPEDEVGLLYFLEDNILSMIPEHNKKSYRVEDLSNDEISFSIISHVLFKNTNIWKDDIKYDGNKSADYVGAIKDRISVDTVNKIVKELFGLNNYNVKEYNYSNELFHYFLKKINDEYYEATCHLLHIVAPKEEPFKYHRITNISYDEKNDIVDIYYDTVYVSNVFFKDYSSVATFKIIENESESDFVYGLSLKEVKIQ